MVIAIDGPAGAGKSTVARARRRALGFTYLDSGAMYRSVALAALRAAPISTTRTALGSSRPAARDRARGRTGEARRRGRERGDPDRPRSRRPPRASSVHPEVREAMVERQRALIAAGDYVAEGRDIGTVVSPDAPLKVFLTASDAERARRRAARDRGARAPTCSQPRRIGTRRDTRARARRAARRRRRGRDRHDRALSVEDVVGADRRAGARAGSSWAIVTARPAEIAVVGFPNVGKSTLVNRLAGGREAVVHSEPGVTRDRKALDCEWNGARFRLVDTGGVDLDGRGLAVARRCSARRARRSPRRTSSRWWWTLAPGCGPATPRSPSILRRGEVPVIVVANKIDQPGERLRGRGVPPAGARGADRRLGHPRARDAATCWTALGGAGCRASGARALRAEEAPVGVAVIGQAQRRQVVARQRLPRHRAGDRLRDRRHDTRRDRHRARRFDGRAPVLVDTAGLRRRTKVAGSVDYYAQLRSERAAERADVALVVCDASEGVTAEDLRVAELAMRSGCATLMALNKWDVGATDLEDARREGQAQDAPAPAGAHLLGDHRPQRAAKLSSGDRARRAAGPAHPDPGAQPRRSATSSPAARRRPSAAGGCGSTTRRRSASARRGSRSRSTTGG